MGAALRITANSIDERSRWVIFDQAETSGGYRHVRCAAKAEAKQAICIWHKGPGGLIIADTCNSSSQTTATAASQSCFSPYLHYGRHLVERFFNKIKQCRRVATCYDKLAANNLAFIQLASTWLWLRVNKSTS